MLHWHVLQALHWFDVFYKSSSPESVDTWHPFLQRNQFNFCFKWEKIPIDFEWLFQFTDNCRGFMGQFMKYCKLTSWTILFLKKESNWKKAQHRKFLFLIISCNNLFKHTYIHVFIYILIRLPVASVLPVALSIWWYLFLNDFICRL